MKVIVTCGPSIEPIDEVRCITNFSTGELGIRLSNTLAAKGFDVICLKGSHATCPIPLDHVETRRFATNADLLTCLQKLSGPGIAAVFHVAALCDFELESVKAADSTMDGLRKISGVPSLQISLKAAPKLIASLRELFPAAKIIGWKYELDGTPQSALEKGARQMTKNRTDACVVNGSAYGEGFAFCERGEEPHHLADKATLCQHLSEWLARERFQPR
ncbi:MAG: phosphopantothenoylcysteine decarboxylase [Chthoniobacteraceae bacterium]